MNKPTNLPPYLADTQRQIEGYARDYGLDFFDTIFEVLDYKRMNEVAAYGGFPVRYPHWRWGMEYERLSKRDAYGLGRIYEMVINNDPCYAYLQESNAVTDQKLVMAHVYGHADFFKNNYWFSKTDRKMMDQMANHATRVRRHIERHGQEAVEAFVDACLSIEHLIDPHSMFVQREEPRSRAAVMSMRAICSITYSRSVRGGGRSRTTRPPAIRGLSSASARRPSASTGAGACAGRTTFRSVPGKRQTCLAPEHFPRLAIGSPSISMMSSAKESTGALAIEVPTP